MASANDRSQRLQSNEEVIEELTRDLESSCVRADSDRPSDANARSKDDSWDIVDKECDESGDDNAHIYDTNVPSEDVDEELLKDRDLLLTESEQEVCSHCSVTGHSFAIFYSSVRCNPFTFAGVQM